MLGKFYFGQKQQHSKEEGGVIYIIYKFKEEV